MSSHELFLATAGTNFDLFYCMILRSISHTAQVPDFGNQMPLRHKPSTPNFGNRSYWNAGLNRQAIVTLYRTMENPSHWPNRKVRSKQYQNTFSPGQADRKPVCSALLGYVTVSIRLCNRPSHDSGREVRINMPKSDRQGPDQSLHLEFHISTVELLCCNVRHLAILAVPFLQEPWKRSIAGSRHR